LCSSYIPLALSPANYPILRRRTSERAHSPTPFQAGRNR